MVGKGNLAVFEGSSISKTEIVTPTKIGVHALHIHCYLQYMNFLSRFQSIKFFHFYGPYANFVQALYHFIYNRYFVDEINSSLV